MGKLFDDIRAESTAQTTRWKKVVESLSEDDRKDLEEALADETITNASIVRVLRNRNIVVDRNTVSKWRKGER